MQLTLGMGSSEAAQEVGKDGWMLWCAGWPDVEPAPGHEAVQMGIAGRAVQGQNSHWNTAGVTK